MVEEAVAAGGSIVVGKMLLLLLLLSFYIRGGVSVSEGIRAQGSSPLQGELVDTLLIKRNKGTIITPPWNNIREDISPIYLS